MVQLERGLEGGQMLGLARETIDGRYGLRNFLGDDESLQ